MPERKDLGKKVTNKSISIKEEIASDIGWIGANKYQITNFSLMLNILCLKELNKYPKYKNKHKEEIEKILNNLKEVGRRYENEGIPILELKELIKEFR